MNSPVLRGEDEPETFSCQLYFFPKELLFNVSCEKEKQMKRVKERKAWSPSSGSWKSMNTTFCPLSLSLSLNLALSFAYAHTHSHIHTHSFYSVEWELNESLLSVLSDVNLKGTRPFPHWEHAHIQTHTSAHQQWEPLIDGKEPFSGCIIHLQSLSVFEILPQFFWITCVPWVRNF